MEISSLTGELMDSFHRFSKEGYPTGIIDAVIAEFIKSSNDILVIEGKPYIYRDGVFVQDAEGIELQNLIKQCIYTTVQTAKRIKAVYDLLLMDKELAAKFEDMNKMSDQTINFRNGMLFVPGADLHDPLIPHDPCFKALNQIPHDFKGLLKPEQYENSVLKRWLWSVVPNDDDREMLLEFIGYSMTISTNQQKMLVITGTGGTGKSTLVNLISKVVGAENISNVSLQNLNEKFYPTNLQGKLLNCCADITNKALEQTDVIKKIIGEDTIMGEYKGGKIFFFKNYAKMLFSANEIPITLDEKSNAFFRRLLIIRMDKRAEHIKDFDRQILSNESVEIMLSLAVEALQQMYERGCRILESGSSKENVAEYYRDSDTVQAFLEDRTEQSATSVASRGSLYKEYCHYCESKNWRYLSNKKFFANLRGKGFEDVKHADYRYFKGIKIKEDFIDASKCNIPFND